MVFVKVLAFKRNIRLIFHENDVWKQVNKPQSPPATLTQVTKRSRWNAEYLTVNFFMIFQKLADPYEYPPIIII